MNLDKVVYTILDFIQGNGANYKIHPQKIFKNIKFPIYVFYRIFMFWTLQVVDVYMSYLRQGYKQSLNICIEIIPKLCMPWNSFKVLS